MRSLLAFALFLSLLLLSLVSARSADDLVPAETFEHIKNSPVPRLTLFYFSSDPQSEEILDTIVEAAQQLDESGFLREKQFSFARCDGDDEDNVGEFRAASFAKRNDGPSYWIFSSTPSEGIVRYSGRETAAAISSYIQSKYLDFDPSDVATFSSEDDFYATLDGENGAEEEKPLAIFVKFFENWCQHCKRLKQPFQQAATYFTQRNKRVQFMEVECSANEESRLFCSSNEVQSYPTLILFDGENKVKYQEEMRTIDSFDQFFAKNLAEYVPLEEQNEAAEKPKKKVKPAEKVAKKKEAKKPKEAGQFSKAAKKAAKPSSSSISEEDFQELQDKVEDLESKLDRVVAVVKKLRSRVKILEGEEDEE